MADGTDDIPVVVDDRLSTDTLTTAVDTTPIQPINALPMENESKMTDSTDDIPIVVDDRFSTDTLTTAVDTAPIEPINALPNENTNALPIQDLPPAHCGDGLYNLGEYGLDCEGTCATACAVKEMCESIDQDATWEGNVRVVCPVTVKNGATLTILPGTVIRFDPNRDYRKHNRSLLSVIEANLVANGSEDKRIWLTSDGRPPLNGDWVGLSIERSQGSELSYVIVEFGLKGISVVDSRLEIDHAIVRWNNDGGIHVEGSAFSLRDSMVYENGIHLVTIEQKTTATISYSLLSGSQFGIYVDDSYAIISNNYLDDIVYEYIGDGNKASTVVADNVIREREGSLVLALNPDLSSDVSGNVIDKLAESTLTFTYSDLSNDTLPYIPCTEEDLFPYVFAEEDETRRILGRLGQGLQFGSSLTTAFGLLWRFESAADFYGENIDFYSIDSNDGTVTYYFNDDIVKPYGLAHDGVYFYVNDLSLRSISKFIVEGDKIIVKDSFPVPESEKGGLLGLATDGEYLYQTSRDRTKLYKLEKTGLWIDTIDIALQEGYLLEHALTFDGTDFWISGGCERGLCRFSRTGELLGGIYPATKIIGDLAWDGTTLWTLQDTCLFWKDAKIFHLSIKDDSLGL